MAPAANPGRARAEALVLPRALHVPRLLPSGASVAVALGVLVAAAAVYVLARESSAFAIRSVEVRGVPSGEAAQVRGALAPLLGTSLLSLDESEIRRRIGGLASIRSFHHDRAFPHTLVVVARRERPVAVVRRGPGSWLVSARGRLIAPVSRSARADLPRIWVPKRVVLSEGATLADDDGARAARLLALLRRVRFPFDARTVRLEGELTYILRSRLELRLGSSKNAELKLAVARRIVPQLPPETLYLDLRVPERPVAATSMNPQVEGRG